MTAMPLFFAGGGGLPAENVAQSSLDVFVDSAPVRVLTQPGPMADPFAASTFLVAQSRSRQCMAGPAMETAA